MDLQHPGELDFLDDEAKLPAIEWLAEQMPGGFFIYKNDVSQELLYINLAACRIFGCSTVEEFKELTGYTFYGMVHHEDYDRIQSSIDKQIDEDIEHQMDYVVYRIIRKDGQVRWVDDYGHQTILPGFGKVFYVFIGDITDTRMVEEEKERNKLLQKSLREAEQANIAKMTFLSNMSHEIRTPITTILGMNEMISRETKDKDILYYSDNIRNAGSNLLGIISDILDISKVEAGRLELVPAPYSLPDLIGDLYNGVQFRAEDKGLSLRFDIDPKLPMGLVGDELRIKQIVSNLLTNAIKYTEKGSVTLTFKLLEASEQKVTMYIAVIDTGIGIREEEMDLLFDTFSRLDTRRTHTIEGAGLGLPICQELVKMMGADLQVSSVYDEGSTFSFCLEQEVSDPTEIGVLDRKMTSRHIRTYSGAFDFVAPESRILLVDDTPMNVEVIAGLMKPTKIMIDVARSGTECIYKFEKQQYDLVFLDYRMPEMDGIETLTEMTSLFPEKVDSTPIVSLTASAVYGERERMLEAGFTDYLSKPVSIPEMTVMLTRYLPKEKIIYTDKQGDGDFNEGISMDVFERSWLDPKVGLEYCGSESLYVAALELFEKTIDEKATILKKSLNKGDIDLYTVTVHGLKSTSLSIGMNSFSGKARKLELASKNGDIDFLSRETPDFLKTYRSFKPKLKKIIKKAKVHLS